MLNKATCQSADRDKGISNSCLKAERTVVTSGSKGWVPRSPLFRYMTKSSSASQGLLILLQVSDGNAGLVIRGHALPIHQHLASRSTPFVFKLSGHAPTVGQAFHLLQLRFIKTTLDSPAQPIFQLIVIDTVVQRASPVHHRVDAPRPHALGALDSEGPSPLVFSQQLGSSHEIARSKAVRTGGYGGLEQPSPDHRHVVAVDVGRCHVDAGMNALFYSHH